MLVGRLLISNVIYLPHAIDNDYEPASKQRDVTWSTRCNQPALFRTTHILSKKKAMLSYA